MRLQTPLLELYSLLPQRGKPFGMGQRKFLHRLSAEIDAPYGMRRLHAALGVTLRNASARDWARQ